MSELPKTGQMFNVYQILSGEVNPSTAIGYYSHLGYYRLVGKAQLYRAESIKLIGSLTIKKLK